MADMKNIIDAMTDWERFFGNLFARLDGPLHFRLIVQPLMAAIFAVRDGIKDASSRNPAYFWAVCTNSGHRKDLIKNGWKHIGKVFIMAVIIDVFYQIKVNHWVYPGETLMVAVVLAIVPYLLLRGPINRILQWRANAKLSKLKSGIGAD